LDNKLDQLQLVYYRVEGSKGVNFMTRKLTKDDVIKRRAIMRQILKESMFNNRSNEQLDSMRIEKADLYFVVEDSNGYQTVIGYKNKKALNDDANIEKDQ
jgi:hypothetical protein